jgi:hypothetical protein
MVRGTHQIGVITVEILAVLRRGFGRFHNVPVVGVAPASA